MTNNVVLVSSVQHSVIHIHVYFSNSFLIRLLILSRVPCPVR